jgi:predicted ATPase with chaperone activity
MMARALPTVVPKVTINEALEVIKIYSVRGLFLPETPFL